MDQTHFPPIEDYAFLSDCETTALIAPDGAVEWLCLPRMDSPSVFGAILDRDAGHFRVGPAGVDVPSARRYIPGTLVVETSWWTPGGWLVVTDALLIGPWHHEDERSSTHRRAPTDYDAAHVLLRVIRCVNGQVQVDMDCTPGVRLRPVSCRNGRTTGDGYHEAVAAPEGGGSRRATAHHRSEHRVRGPHGHRTHTPQRGAAPIRRAVVEQTCAADDPARRRDTAALDLPPLAALARSRHLPRPSMARPPATQCTHAQGPRASPRRAPWWLPRPRRSRKPLAASAIGTTATPGYGTPPKRCGRSTSWVWTGRPKTSSGSSPMSPRPRTVTCS